MSFFMQIFLQFKIYPGAIGNVPDPIRLQKYYNLYGTMARKFAELSSFTRNLSDLSGALVRIVPHCQKCDKIAGGRRGCGRGR